MLILAALIVAVVGLEGLDPGSGATAAPPKAAQAVPPELVAPPVALPPEIRVLTYGPVGELRLLTPTILPPDVQAVFDTEFAIAAHFSAFAWSKGGGWGYATTTNSIQGARNIALAQCRTQGPGCGIIAEIVPPGFVDPLPTEITMAPEAEAYLTDPRRYEAFSAMAVSEDGAYSLVWGYATLAEAEAQALADCESSRMTGIEGLPPMPCVLVPPPEG